IPPIKEQKQIAEILSTVDNKIENLKENVNVIEELKKGLIQKLLTGEVRV
ncbi:MAG: restriction endonuclease subunit S, partial [Fusobacteriaceae bacterium]|nr:restriction endonuclease subunit S [Fusobacteriaceae bacterium]